MPKSECHQLFVYGSLRKGFNSPAYGYISQFFECAGEGTICGKLYDLGEYPAAIPGGDECFIKGELYRIKNADEFEWAIAQLDDYEGIDASFDETALYQRVLTEVKMNDGSQQNAWVYWYTGSVEGKPRINSGDLLEYMAGKASQ